MREVIIRYIQKAVGGDIVPDVEIPENKNFGHYSTNVALKIAKRESKNPIEVATHLAQLIKKEAPKGLFETIEAVPPGFINFRLSAQTLHRELRSILEKKEAYGKGKVRRGEKIQIEYVSANPTGPLTLANGRGGFFGDALANILAYKGNTVEREYYVNDTGNQVMTLGKSLLAAQGIIANEDNFYQGAYVKEWARMNTGIVKKLQGNPLRLGQYAAKTFVKLIKMTLEKEAEIIFDRYTSEEQHIHKKSFIEKARKIFEKKGMTYKKDDAVWFKSTHYGDEKDRVIITRDGFPTYFMADAGHYLETKSRGFNQKILILGPDHHGYVPRIKAVAEVIGMKKSEVIITQTVRLMKNGEEVKMSKRTGEFITFKELLDEIPHEAARFFFLMYSPNTHMDFDMNLAKERSVKNPVYYIQYAAVRCGSIITRAGAASGIPDMSALTTPEDYSLIRMLMRFPEIVESAAIGRNPQVLARYALDCAREFNNFYEKEHIIGEEKSVMRARLALVRGTYIVFKTTLKLLGTALPKKM